MSTNNEHDQDKSPDVPPVVLPPDETAPEHAPAVESPTERGVTEEATDEARETLVIAEPSTIEPGTLEPVVVEVAPEHPDAADAGPSRWASPAEPARPSDPDTPNGERSEERAAPNPYAAYTTAPPMSPTTPVTPAAEHRAAEPTPTNPSSPSGIPGGEIYASAVPVYLAPPTPPAAKGNRLGGGLIALLGAVIFAVVYAAVACGFFIFGAGVESPVETLLRFLGNAAFIVPVIFFAVSLVLLVIVVNRAGWWAYVLGGFLVGVVVYAGAIVGAFISVSGFGMGEAERSDFLGSLVMDPLPLAAGIVAREVTVWAGAWIAARGRRVKARNVAAHEEYEATLAEPRVGQPSGNPAW